MFLRLNINLAFIILMLYPELFYSEKITTESICLKDTPEIGKKKIQCLDSKKRLIITQVQYLNDYLKKCVQQDSVNSTKSIKSMVLCSAYPTQQFGNLCNGKQECVIDLARKKFQYGFDGSNCDFKSEILVISYQCIPDNMNQISIPRYNICPGGVIDHPLIGFIHSPNYPDSYDSSQFCQLTLKMNEQITRIEVFLINIETEGLSKRHFGPTDYLQINNKEKIYGKKSFSLIYNDTTDATIVFKSDLFFNQKGFVLYFEAIKKPEPKIELIEENLVTQSSLLVINETLNITNHTEFFIEPDTYLNTTQTFNDTNSSITFDIAKFKSEKYLSLSEPSEIITNQTYFNELTLKMIIPLVVVLIVLTSIVIFLILINRKTFFSKSVKYMDPYLISNNSQFNDTSLVNGYLESNNLVLNGSVVLATNSSSMVNYLSHDGKNRLSKDSLKLVLISKNINDNKGKMSSTETYDEINNMKEKLSKVNEYCYIQTNGMVSGGQEVTLDFECANDESRKMSSDSDMVSPKFESIVTSTPSAPKSLPPSKYQDQKEIEDNSYQTLDKTNTRSVYRSCFDESNNEYVTEESTQTIFKTTIEVEQTLVNKKTDENNFLNDEKDSNNDYQIPSNIYFSN